MAGGTTATNTFNAHTVTLNGGNPGNYRLSGVLNGLTDTSSQGTPASTTDTALHTLTLPANTLDTDGQSIRITSYGTFAPNTNTKTVRVWLGAVTTGTLVAELATNVNITGGDWLIWLDIIRTGAATQKSMGYIWTREPLATGTDRIHAPLYAEPTETLSSTMTIIVSGENGIAAANDIVAEVTKLEFLP